MTEATVKFVFNSADTKRTVIWPCTFNQPLDGGTTQAYSVDVRFNIVGRDVYNKTFDDAVAANARGDLALYDLLVDGFPTFADANGAIVGDAAAKPFFRSQDFMVRGILASFAQMRMGIAAKN